MAAPFVCNYSSEPLLVIDRKPNGDLVRRPVPTNKVTPSAANPVGVIGEDGQSIRDHHDGWHLETGLETFIYDRSTFLGFLFPELDLHCIPTTATSLDPAYRKAKAGEFDAIVLDPDPSWAVNAPARGPRDGHIEVEVDNDLSPWTWKNSYFYIRSGANITLRLRFGSQKPPTDAEREDFRKRLRAAIARWNDPSVMPPSDGSPKLVFRVEIVPDFEDQFVELVPGYPRSKSKIWDQHATEVTIAHEIGHHLGLIDEYYRGIQKGNTLQQAKRREAKEFPYRTDRRRLTGLCTNPTKNLMETEINPVIDQSLIDSVHLQSDKQVLCER